MNPTQARESVERAHAHAPSFGRGSLIATFSIRHRAGLDVVFVTDGSTGEFQIGMGAASNDFTTVLTIGVDSHDGRLQATGTWTRDGRPRAIPVRIVRHSRDHIVIEAGSLPLDKRPQALKCWSFLRHENTDDHSDVIGFVSPELESLPAVALKTYPSRRH